MLILPGKFRRELEKAWRQPFALATIEGAGVSDEATSEADWSPAGKQVQALGVDWDSTPAPPQAGDVILASDETPGGENTVGPLYPSADYENTMDQGGGWDDVNDPESDSNYVYTNGTFLGVAVPSGIPDNAVIKEFTITVRMSDFVGFPADGFIGYSYLGVKYWDGGRGLGGWANYTWTRNTNPVTGQPWTKEEILAIDGIGVRLQASGRASVVKWEIVYYDKLTNGHMAVELDLTGANPDGVVTVSIDSVEPTGTSLLSELTPVQNMRPVGHYDATNDTANEAQAYDEDEDTASTTTADQPGQTFYIGRDSGNVDQWDPEIASEAGAVATIYVIAERGSSGGTQTGIEVQESDGTLVTELLAKGLGAVSKQTYSFDVSSYIGDLADLRVIVDVQHFAGSQTLQIYEVWIELKINTGTTVEDGSRIQNIGVEDYHLKATFAGDGTATPVLRSVGLSIPDQVYKYNTLKQEWNGSIPLLTAVPGRTIRLNPESFITEGSSLELSLNDKQLISDTLLADEYMKGLPVKIDFGFFAPDITEDDLVPYYQGLVNDYKITEDHIVLQLRDATKSLERKIPETVGEVKGIIEFDRWHMVDAVGRLIDLGGVLGRFLNSGSLEEVKADMGVGVGDPSPSDFIVFRSDNLVGVGGPNTLIQDPKPAKSYIKELLELIGAYLVTQEDGRLQMILYDPTNPTVDDWLTTRDIQHGAKFNAKIESTLRNLTVVYYEWDGSGSDGKDYLKAYAVGDQDSIDRWEQVNKIIKSNWLAQEPVAGQDYKGRLVSAFIAARETNRLKNGVGTFTCTTSLDKLEVQVGEMVTVYSDLIQSKNNPVPGAGALMLVVKKTWAVDSGEISWELVEAT